MYFDQTYDLYIDGQKITEVTIPDTITDLCAKAFEGCQSITSVTIPENVKTIGENAFSNCPNLTDFTIENGLTAIGDEAFYSSYGLTSLTIPESVVRIGFNAFYDCGKLKDIIFNDTTTNWYKTDNKAYTEGKLFGTMSENSAENAKQLIDTNRANYWYNEKYVVE